MGADLERQAKGRVRSERTIDFSQLVKVGDDVLASAWAACSTATKQCAGVCVCVCVCVSV